MKNKMKNKIMWIMLLMFSGMCFSLKADESEIVLCMDDAKEFGNGRGTDQLSRECINLVKKEAPKNARKESGLLKMRIFGFKNMLIFEKLDPKKLIWRTEITAGINTELNHVKALALDEKNEEIAVLDESGEVAFYSTKITGNVAPYRVLRNQKLVGAEELSIDSLRDRITIYHQKNKQNYTFSRLANVNARPELQKLQLIKIEQKE